jgi:RNA polymerase sigma factor (sigma-70 family)
MDTEHDTEQLPVSAEVVTRLVANHRDFLGFLQARTGSRVLAEELLQAAFVRALEKGQTLREDESAVAWFYRLLRNALIDHHRRAAVEGRVKAKQAAHAEPSVDPELRDVICQCITTLLPTLKPEYSALIAQVDLAERPLSEVAKALAITTNNAHVRLHRARQALKQQLERSCGTCAAHGCLDCTCSSGCHTSIERPSK